MFVAPGAQLAGNTRGPLGVVEAEYVDMEGDEVGVTLRNEWGGWEGRAVLFGRSL